MVPGWLSWFSDLAKSWAIGGFDSQQEKLIYIFTRKSRSAVEAYRRLLPLGVKRPGGEFDHSPATSAELSMNESVVKALFINPTDANNYKITGMLKQLKFPQLLRHVSVHSGTIIRVD